MSLSMLMGQFFDPSGKINIPEELTLVGIAELAFQAAQASGTLDEEQIFFHDYRHSVEGKVETYTRRRINTRIKAVAARLQQVTEPGQKVAILAGNSPEYIYGFLGALYAGVAPIPLYDPTEPAHAEQLPAVLEVAQPSVVLTDKFSAAAVRKHFADRPGSERPRILSIDVLPDALSQQWTNPYDPANDSPYRVSSSNTAFYQFTSGSTRTPNGVELTHRSIVTNVLQIFSGGQLGDNLRLVTWAPLHHNMGIIITAFITIAGIPYDLMGPRDFLQDPRRWIRLMGRRGQDPEKELDVYTMVPNFALELAARYADPKQNPELADLDLSAVKGIINGSEPVTMRNMNRFIEVFQDYGLDRTVMRPSYGLAEASVLVSTPQTERRPWLVSLDREQLAAGQAMDSTDESAVHLYSVGQACAPQVVAIVDPETGEEREENRIGEIWIHGDNVAAGYLDREEETEQVFHNALPSEKKRGGAPSSSISEDAAWMRTGDLGFLREGEIFITGRLKDLIIVAGRNHYPQDIEATVTASTPHIKPGIVAAFTVSAEELGDQFQNNEDGEQLIIVAERDPESQPEQDDKARTLIRSAVVQRHGIRPAEVLIVPENHIPRSSSNKIARRVTARAFVKGSLGSSAVGE